MYSQIVDSFGVDDKIQLDFNAQAGFYITAKRDLNPTADARSDTHTAEGILRIPFESVLCPYDPFPYKETVIKAIAEIIKKDEYWEYKFRINSRNLVSAIMLYIERNLDSYPGMKMYKERSQLNRDFIFSFPEKISRLSSWDEETYQFYADISFGYLHKANFFGIVYKHFMEALLSVADPKDTNALLQLFANKEDLEY